jgi:hypothetical protein
MKSNLHKLDRVLRIAVAAVLAYLLYGGQIEGVAGTIATVVAIIFALTSVINFCPLYAAMGISTKEK